MTFVLDLNIPIESLPDQSRRSTKTSRGELLSLNLWKQPGFVAQVGPMIRIPIVGMKERKFLCAGMKRDTATWISKTLQVIAALTFILLVTRIFWPLGAGYVASWIRK